MHMKNVLWPVFFKKNWSPRSWKEKQMIPHIGGMLICNGSRCMMSNFHTRAVISIIFKAFVGRVCHVWSRFHFPLFFWILSGSTWYKHPLVVFVSRLSRTEIPEHLFDILYWIAGAFSARYMQSFYLIVLCL